MFCLHNFFIFKMISWRPIISGSAALLFPKFSTNRSSLGASWIRAAVTGL